MRPIGIAILHRPVCVSTQVLSVVGPAKWSTTGCGTASSPGVVEGCGAGGLTSVLAMHERLVQRVDQALSGPNRSNERTVACGVSKTEHATFRSVIRRMDWNSWGRADVMAVATRDFSVYPVWITGASKHEYAKVHADEGAIGVGRRVSIQRQGETTWRRATVTGRPDGRDGHGFMVWLDVSSFRYSARATPVGSR